MSDVITQSAVHYLRTVAKALEAGQCILKAYNVEAQHEEDTPGSAQYRTYRLTGHYDLYLSWLDAKPPADGAP
jgi:hypothetical protein